MADSESFDGKAFKKNPEILMPIVDEAIKAGNYTKEGED